MSLTDIGWTATPLNDVLTLLRDARVDGETLLAAGTHAAGELLPGFTFNPWIGCEKVSRACKRCYAEAWSRRVDELPLRRHVRCVVRLRRDERTLFALVQVPVALEPVTIERDPAHPGCGAQRLAGELVGLSLTAACIAINDGYAHIDIDPRTARPTRRERGLSDPGAWRVAPADAERLGWGAEADNAKLLPTWRAARIERRVQARLEAPALRLVPAPEVTRG